MPFELSKPPRFRCKAVRRALMQQLWEALLAEPETEASAQQIRPEAI